MSCDIAIKVENLSKIYQIYDKPHDRLLQMLAGNKKRYFREFSALKNINFDVKKGETVGIIGHNGSGKSTLLQLICGTLNPSSGEIQTQGRIAALLELGSGFNPEFTGRENIYMNGSILGLSQKEIEDKFNAIIDFADIGDFIEQPVKNYSSGMVVRLAFAVAINVEPQILIVDEALSVGDERFQRKCFSKIEAIRNAGATILFVSHSGGTIVELCDRAILLDSGEMLAIGQPKKMVSAYQRLLYAPDEERIKIRLEIIQSQLGTDLKNSASSIIQATIENIDTRVISHKTAIESFDPSLIPSSTERYASRGASISTPKIFTLEGKQVNGLIRGKIYRYSYIVTFTQSASNVRFGMLIKTLSGIELGGGVSASSARNSIPYVEVGQQYQVEFKFRCALNPGTFFLNAGVVGTIGKEETYLDRLIDAAMFRVNLENELLATGTIDFNCDPWFSLNQ